MSSACRRLPRLACSNARFFPARSTYRRCTSSAPTYSTGGSTPIRWQASFAARRGKGVEPAQWDHQRPLEEMEEEEEEEEDAAIIPVQPSESQGRHEPRVVPIGGDMVREELSDGDAAKQVPPSDQEVQPTSDVSATDSDSSASPTAPGDPDTSVTAQQTSASRANDSGKETMDDSTPKNGPLEAVLHMPSPTVVAQKHPHMAPPPYVHHFDTYSLVKELGEGGYTQDQAITVMKGVRAILAQNLDVAQESLVSKSDVENESYLFRAACSELSTEIKNNRRLQDERMRQERTHLQHEVDILTQSLNQELLTLNDTVRGMFNDRKMAVREEQKSVESAVQQISYKISIMLSSDAKSEIESVRWILIRRSVLGILFMAVLTLGTLRYATYVSQERAREAERLRKEQEELRRDGGRKDQASAADAAVILAAN